VSPRHQQRRMLPLLTNSTSGRQAVTCKYRCGDACSHPAPNTSDNEYFGDVVRKALSRRGVLRTGAIVAVAGAGAAVLGGNALAGGSAAPTAGRRAADPAPGTNFTPVAPNSEDAVVVAEGYEQQVLIRWGDPVVAGAPEFDFDNQTAAAQAKQFGFNNDYCTLVPVPGRDDAWLMVSNHEYSAEPFMFKGYDPAKPTKDQVEIAWAAHGMSVVLFDTANRAGALQRVPSSNARAVDYNRRITARTSFSLRGPARGSKYLRTSANPTGTAVFGTLNNCAGGRTPWGTVLSGEENFNQYFANGDQATGPTTQERLKRYGLFTGASERKWELFDKRFDLAQEPNEANRFGWIVEVDPLEPGSTPVKHTALGRFKHEGANIIVAQDGRVVAYMGDDERFDYMYKFVSDGKMKPGMTKLARDHNKKLLDSGKLYVAKFTGDSPASEIDGTGTLPADGKFDGGGKWILLAHNDKSYVPGFTAEQVYVFTRLAADKVGATKMDRPEDVEPNPKTRRVYAALTNNKDRGAAGKAGPDEANPRNGNRHGHVLELVDKGFDNTATLFTWRLLLVCGDPADPSTYFAGYDKTQVSPISCPDNVAFDRFGNLWISTDGNALGKNDGVFAVPLEGAERGHVKQFLTVPVGAEACGPIINQGNVLVSVQHPGELDGHSADNPGSHWPDGGSAQPRPAVVAVWNPNGDIGS
jgi:secreted PhoX family phosphatase